MKYFQIQGMPIFHAFECFMEANLVRWGPSTNYQQGACGVVQACYDAGFDIQKVSYDKYARDVKF